MPFSHSIRLITSTIGLTFHREPTLPRWRFGLVGIVLYACIADIAHADEPKLPPPADRKIDFVKDVQPLFAARCYECHGSKKQESAYRLDHKGTALKAGALGDRAIVPGKSAESPLVKYVAGIDKDLKMPPKGDLLTAEQVGIIRAWIDQGAEWPDSASVTLDLRGKDHWAFKAPVRPAEPDVTDKNWAKTPIDRFILARLEKEKLKPSAEADKITLLRRLYLDLIGLPPSPKEVDDFLADSALPNNQQQAYEKVVEKLLASPHYGERWGRHWLDAARYADSDGYEKDKQRYIYFYRDWVIGAFNRDLPYNQFVIEQLAGDLLPNATQDQIVATGFLRNSMINEEGGVDPEQFRMDAMFDRMDAVGKSVLGLTIQCAQCHTHKFDPIQHEEYYRIFAYLNNDHEAQRTVYAADELMKVAQLSQQIKDLEAGLMHSSPDWEAKLAAWEQSVQSPVKWTTLAVENGGDNGQRYIPQKDGSILCQGYAPTKFDTHMKGESPLKTVRAFRVELLNDPNLPCNGPGRSFMGTCALTEFKVTATDKQDRTKTGPVKITKAAADFGNPDRPLEPNFDDKTDKKRVTGPIEYAIDGKDETAWGIDAGPGRRNVPRVAIFIPEKPVEMAGGTELSIYLRQMHGGWNSDDNMNNNVGRFRLSVTDAEVNPALETLPPRVREVLAIEKEKRSPAQVAVLFSYWRTTVPEWKETNDKIESLWQQWPKGSTSLILDARTDPRDTRILSRGDFLKPTRPVSAGVPAFLHPLADEKAPATRLTFAQWLVDNRSPTTARVFVNRVWQAYFGTGLVSTPEDFGLQSDKPSHPELLDWLACEFMDKGWSIKGLHRLIVNSAVYKQSSRITPELYEKDPYNRLLARAPRLRVEGEVVRDVALAASGLLNPKVGGPPVFAPAPAFLFLPPASYGPFVWTEATGPERYRRAVYTFRRRSTPYPMLTNFDVPNGDFSCVRRTRSNTPLQALTTLNETVFMECSRAMAVRVLKEAGKTDDERLAYAFRLCVSRAPEADEVAALKTLLEKQRKRVSDGWVNPAEIATGEAGGKVAPPEGATPADVALYTLISRVLLNMDETITKE